MTLPLSFSFPFTQGNWMATNVMQFSIQFFIYLHAKKNPISICNVTWLVFFSMNSFSQSAWGDRRSIAKWTERTSISNFNSSFILYKKSVIFHRFLDTLCILLKPRQTASFCEFLFLWHMDGCFSLIKPGALHFALERFQYMYFSPLVLTYPTLTLWIGEGFCVYCIHSSRDSIGKGGSRHP